MFNFFGPRYQNEDEIYKTLHERPQVKGARDRDREKVREFLAIITCNSKCASKNCLSSTSWEGCIVFGQSIENWSPKRYKQPIICAHAGVATDNSAQSLSIILRGHKSENKSMRNAKITRGVWMVSLRRQHRKRWNAMLALVVKCKLLLLDAADCIKWVQTHLNSKSEGRNSAFSANIHQNIKQHNCQREKTHYK